MQNDNNNRLTTPIITDLSQVKLRDLVDMAARGASLETIATRVGLTLSEFKAAMEWVNPESGRQDFKRAMEMGRAEFEYSRIMLKDQLLNDPNTKTSDKIKILQRDLATLKNWAPASRTLEIKAVKDDSNSSPEFAELTYDELEAIRKATEEADRASGVSVSDDPTAE